MVRLAIYASLLCLICSKSNACDSARMDVAKWQQDSIFWQCVNLWSVDTLTGPEHLTAVLATLKSSELDALAKIELYKRIERILHANQCEAAVRGDLLHDYAALLANKFKDFNKACQLYHQALHFKYGVSPVDRKSIGRSLTNLALSHYYREELDSVIYYVDKLQAEDWDLDQSTLARLRYIQGKSYGAEGLLEQANSAYSLAAMTALSVRQDSISVIDFYYIPMGLLYMDFRYMDEAASLFNQGLALLPPVVEGGQYLKRALSLYNNLSACYNTLGQMEKSIPLLLKSVSGYKRLGDTATAQRSLLNLSTAYSNLDEVEAAEHAFSQVDSYLAQHHDPKLLALYYDHLAQHFRRQCMFDQALDLRRNYLRSLGERYKDFNSEHYEYWSARDLNIMVQALQSQAVVYRDIWLDTQDKPWLDSAYYYLERAHHYRAITYSQCLDPKYSTDLATLSNDLMSESLDIMTTAEDLDPYLPWLFNRMERYRAASLISIMRDGELKQMLQELRPLMDSIHLIEDVIEANLTSTDYNEKAAQQIFDLRERLSTLNRIKYDRIAIHPAAQELFSRTTAEEIQASLEEGELMLSYHLSDSNIYCMRIDRHSLDLKFRELPDDFIQMIRRVINVNQYDSKNVQTWISQNRALAQVLFIDSTSLAGYTTCVILPDDVLYHLPFELLLTSDSDAESWRELPYMLRTIDVSYDYSATVWRNMREVNSDQRQYVLLSSPPYSAKTSLTALPGARKEIEEIQQCWPRTLYADELADWKTKLPTAQIIHFAGHAILDNKAPSQSYLAFVDGATSDIEPLYMGDLHKYDIRANPVVLSACNSGSGRLSKGEGFLSLAHGFVSAGARSICYTLWESSDVSSRELMHTFHQYLKGGLSKDEALRQAKIDYIQSAHELLTNPYYWSSFVIMGDMDPVSIQRPKGYLWGMVLLLVALTVFKATRRWIRRSKRLRHSGQDDSSWSS